MIQSKCLSFIYVQSVCPSPSRLKPERRSLQRSTRTSWPLMSMHQSPLNQVKAAERYIRGQLHMGLTTREAACDAQTKNLSDLFRSTSAMSQDECSELFEYLEADNNTFTKDQRTSLAKLANTRCESLANQNTTVSHESNQTKLVRPVLLSSMDVGDHQV